MKVVSTGLLDIFDPQSTETEMPPFLAKAQPINLNSIARVCETDAYTIDLIVGEIVAQLKHQIKIGANLRLFLKIGHISAKNSSI